LLLYGSNFGGTWHKVNNPARCRRPIGCALSHPDRHLARSAVARVVSDQAAHTYLTTIARDPDAARKVLNPPGRHETSAHSDGGASLLFDGSASTTVSNRF